MDISFDPSSIPMLSEALSLAHTQTSVGTVMLAANLDNYENMGDEMVKMMERSVNPGLGANIDIRC